jgi:hypothetical protein
VLAVLQHHDRGALVQIHVLDRLISLALALLPFRSGHTDELVMQPECSHLRGGHLVGVEVAHLQPARMAVSCCLKFATCLDTTL